MQGRSEVFFVFRIFSWKNCIFAIGNNELKIWHVITRPVIGAKTLRQTTLTEQGFAIVERNWHHHQYEIDIIAMRDDVLVVAEVKTRSDKDEDPLEAVDRKKILNMVRSAEAYVK